MRWGVAGCVIALLVLMVTLYVLARHRASRHCQDRPVPVPPATLMREIRHPQRVTLPNGRVVESGYLVYLPNVYETSDTPWPLLMFLHGSGESGEHLDQVAVEGLPRRAHEVDLPFVIVAPQCPCGDDWTYPGQQKRLIELVDKIIAEYRIDPRRIYLTGCSMGGFAVWDLAMAHPHRFAALAPICGRGDPSAAARISHLPVWVFHGARDPAISVNASRKMVEALRDCGSAVKYTEYADGTHDVWTRTYRDPALYEWLLAQRLPQSANP